MDRLGRAAARSTHPAEDLPPAAIDDLRNMERMAFDLADIHFHQQAIRWMEGRSLARRILTLCGVGE